MIISMNKENITGEALQNLLDFCFLHSDRVALTTGVNRKLTSDNYFEYIERMDKIESPSYDFKTLPLLSIETTNRTPVTLGPIVDLCYFQCNDQMRLEFGRMTQLFAPFEIAYVHFEDMVFFAEDRLLLAVCSHEHYATFDLTDAECEEFFRLGLPHDIPSEHWWEEIPK